MPVLRIAAVQAACVLMDRDATIDRVAALTRSAAREGAQLVVLPEVFVPGTPLAGRYRKLMPTGSGRTVWGMGDGSTLRVLDAGVARIGGRIRWENYRATLSSWPRTARCWPARSAPRSSRPRVSPISRTVAQMKTPSVHNEPARDRAAPVSVLCRVGA